MAYTASLGPQVAKEIEKEAEEIKPKSSGENDMWDYVIKTHGQQEFQAVYFIINSKYRGDRFSETAQKNIAEDCNTALSPLGMTDTSKQS